MPFDHTCWEMFNNQKSKISINVNDLLKAKIKLKKIKIQQKRRFQPDS